MQVRNQAQAEISSLVRRRTCIMPTMLGGPSGIVVLEFQLLTKYPALVTYCSTYYKSTNEWLGRRYAHLCSVSAIAEYFRYLRDGKVIKCILFRGN